MNLLLVEDDLDLGNCVRIALAGQGVDVVWVRRFSDAVRALDGGVYDMLLLDLGLPDGDGQELLSRLGRDRQNLPVLVFGARDGLDDRLRTLGGEVDDYLVKPFALAELLSRVRGLARRSFGLEGEGITVRGLTLHEPTRRVMVDERQIDLSRSEFNLLAFLIKRMGRVVTRRVLEEQVLPGGHTNASNALEVHISNLRRKIGQGHVRTVRGIGYVIDAPFVPAGTPGAAS